MTNTSLRLSVFIGSSSCSSILSPFSANGWWYYQVNSKLKAVVCQGKNYNDEIEISYEMFHELSELEKQHYRKSVIAC
jgi:hypothetical protein